MCPYPNQGTGDYRPAMRDWNNGHSGSARILLSLPLLARAISATAIIAYATYRSTLEWTWGLGHNHLDEHFTDLEQTLTDDSLLVIPRSGIIRDIGARNCTAKFGVPRSHIQRMHGHAANALLNLQLLFRCSIADHRFRSTTAFGDSHYLWQDYASLGQLTGNEFNVMRVGLLERSKAAVHSDGDKSALSLSDLEPLRLNHFTWSVVEHVLPSFLSEDSDQTMVAAEESSDWNSDSIDWDVGNSA
ncbi:hypothetical protein C8R44DRAFT_752384 [Mycena epipterygia]|nr:hypothetical protein C8R44DRAFT_752384 [Mycena epipterygia]